jgi:hypothetical protein
MQVICANISYDFIIKAGGVNLAKIFQSIKQEGIAAHFKSE